MKKVLINLFMVILTVGLLAACQAEKQKGTTLDQLAPANADEAEIYAIVGKLQDRISAGEWDQWLELYTDDAVLTSGSGSGNKEISKQQMRDMVEGVSFKITNMVVLDKSISGDQASISVSFDGNGKKQYETYLLTKKSGQWLIYREKNP
jgi:ketosteroid isomerase-like protein